MHWQGGASKAGSSPTSRHGSPSLCSRELGLRARFACVVSGDTLAERKPHPLPLLHAAALAEVSPGECIYVGDAERDVQAAHAAAMPALVANYGYLRADEDSTHWGGDGYLTAAAGSFGLAQGAAGAYE